MPETLTPTLEELRNKRARMRAELDALDREAGERALDPGQRERWENLQTGLDRVEVQIEEARERRSERVRALVERGTYIEAGTGFEDHRRASGETIEGEPSHRRDNPVHDRALRAIEAVSKRSGGVVSDEAFARAEALVRSGPMHSRTIAARWAELTSSPEYESAFAKLVGDPERGHLLWTSEEADAYRAVGQFQIELRQMGVGSGADGGFMVPLTLDPAIILTSDGSISPLREISRVVQTATNSWQGVSSAGVTSHWYSEHAEVSDDTPTLAGPSIPVHRGSNFVPFSFEIGQDAVGFLDELRAVLLDSADQLQAEAFTIGSGNDEPTGIITALDGTASEVTPATAETFDPVVDVLATIEAVPPRFRPRARWNANLSTLNALEQAETTNGSKFYPELGSDRLLRKPVHENSEMRGVADINPAATEDNHILLAGDFLTGFVIVDRIGATLELIPHLFGANRRPTGQRGALLWHRNGSDVVAPNAFRLLNIATAA